MRWYWFPRARYSVTVHLQEDFRYEWRKLFGVSIGRWFIGAIQGDPSWREHP
jgi:hypothetical protein